MTRRDTHGRRWMLLAMGGFFTIVLAIWQNATTTVLARREATLRESVGKLRRVLDDKRVRVQESDAQSAAHAITPADLGGFRPPTQGQVVIVETRVPKPEAAEVQVASASIPSRLMDVLLPSAGARVRSAK